MRILVVHGMSPQKIGYSAPLIDGIADQMHLVRQEKCAIIDTLKSSYGSRSFVQRCKYLQGSKDVRVYELTWSDLSQQLDSAALLYDWRDHGSERLPVNRALKKGLIDEAFSDALVYTGSFGSVMREATIRAICALMTDEKKAPDGTPVTCTFSPRGNVLPLETPPAIVMFSHSLGSMMVFESIAQMLDMPTAPASAFQVTAEDFVRQLKLVGMLANQLPLLYLSRVPAEKKDEERQAKRMQILRANPNPLPIVAVSDPNDLLSFPLDAGWPHRLKGDKARIINITMANVNDVWIAGADPLTAHTGYYKNPCVVRLLVEGEVACSFTRIYGLQYQNPGRIQVDAGVLLLPRSTVAFPLYATVGASSYGFTPAIAVRSGTLVAQLRPTIMRTMGTPVGAVSSDTFTGIGLRLSAFTFTAGADAFRSSSTHQTSVRWSLGTGW